ncbi:hypothetical protein HPB52_009376 [Rhipicephalus sanguineus]|uniref:Uncharacterized protein n=1 Tax=Rhipicephalus sanguineus TaxID=34632 RepID=A0A9D4PQK0_RHISA|nr:hypothetical protein HPB52_009376 [Rhipicephalus sanguineus]
MRSSRASSEEPEIRNRHSGIAWCAKELKAVLAPMPTNEPMIPAWFKNVDALFAALSIPEEVQGTVILPFLSDKMRTFVANQSEAGVMAYPDLKSKVLKELRMTPKLMSDLKEYDMGISCTTQEMAPEQHLPLRDQEQVSQGSNPSANAVQRTLEEPPSCEQQVPNTEGEANTSLEDKGEEEQDAQALEPQRSKNEMSHWPMLGARQKTGRTAW